MLLFPLLFLLLFLLFLPQALPATGGSALAEMKADTLPQVEADTIPQVEADTIPQVEADRDAVPDLDAARIQTGSFEYRLWLRGEPFGEMEVEIEAEDDGERYVMEEELETEVGDQEARYEFARDLTPIRTRMEGTTDVELEYGEGRVEGRVMPPGTTRRRDAISMEAELPEGTREMGTFVMTILASPLEPGYRAGILAFDAAARQERRLEVEVQEEETVEVAAGTFETYRVSVRGLGPGELVLHVTRDAPRLLVRQIWEEEGLVMELEEWDD